MASREQQKKSATSSHFDLLIVGGGSTGAGLALDAASRGLSTLLVEGGDFASGTSSRSTKLIHGGLRYLAQGIKSCNFSLIRLVKEAIREREILARIAPHLVYPIPLMLPFSHWIDKFSYPTLLKLYNSFSKENSSFTKISSISSHEAEELFPRLKGCHRYGGVIYHDGQFCDTRMNLSVVLTAIEQGATALNHTLLQDWIKEGEKICGGRLLDTLSGDTYEVRAKTIINAAGPSVDHLRTLDSPFSSPLLNTSAGTHFVLPKEYAPADTGLIIPQTIDGRVLFVLPWKEHTLYGTTDLPCAPSLDPTPSREEQRYLIDYSAQLFGSPLKEEEVLSMWTGIRPLVANPQQQHTSVLSRGHALSISPSGLITICGGKWTTYRSTAAALIDTLITQKHLPSSPPSSTATLTLVGGSSLPDIPYPFEAEVQEHLFRQYGSLVEKLSPYFEQGHTQHLADGFPYTTAEVYYAVEHEYACCAWDILAFRTNLAFIDAQAAHAALPMVLLILQNLLGWSETRLEQEQQQTENKIAQCQISLDPL